MVWNQYSLWNVKIPSLKLVIKFLLDTSNLDKYLIHFDHIDEKCRDAPKINEAHKERVKGQYYKVVRPRVFFEGYPILRYEKDKYALGEGKFKPMWYGPFSVKKVLKMGAYELAYFDRNELSNPRNGLYLKKYYA